MTIVRAQGVTLVTFDTRLQAPLMIGFFTTIGFGASLSLLRVGGPQVLVFTVLCTLLAVMQNGLGALVAWLIGLHPLFGVLNGSVTLTGGPATGLAFAPLFESAGITGASTIAVASAMAGIISGGLIGGPIGTLLVRRHRLANLHERHKTIPPIAAQIVEDQFPDTGGSPPAGEDKESYALMKALVVILAAMWMGSIVSGRLESWGLTLPAYIGAMLVAAVIRNLDDATGLMRLSQRTIDDLGNVALSLFLVLALMTLRLWELAGLALPIIVILVFQVGLIAAVRSAAVGRSVGESVSIAAHRSGLVSSPGVTEFLSPSQPRRSPIYAKSSRRSSCDGRFGRQMFSVCRSARTFTTIALAATSSATFCGSAGGIACLCPRSTFQLASTRRISSGRISGS